MAFKARSILQVFGDWTSGPPVQASLFQHADTSRDSGIMPEMWNLLRHPVRALVEEWQAPRTRASLFHYVDEAGKTAAVDWKELLKDLVTGYRFALWIPSLWSDQADLAEQRAELRTRKMEAAGASVAIHALVAGLAVFLALYKPVELRPQPHDSVVFINAPMPLPVSGEGREGGGGGGGGKQDKLPPSGGRLPDAARMQLMPPDPGMPKPLLPSENPADLNASVQLPINLPQDSLLPIGDITAPPGGATSSGPGTGDGIGTGRGPGIGSGVGPGAGTGSDGGYGNGHDGGVGNDRGPYFGGGDLVMPEVLYKPTPRYTEEARKARTEGLVVLQATILANGAVTGFKVLLGLGHGLDESAVHTIAGQWKFKPATLRGVPIDFIARIEVTFRLY